jgi:pimeloyl-ACP methyl ester carboxylesterase
VGALVLDSPIVENTDPFYRRSANGAARVLANQCREGYCAAGTDPVADLRGLVARMSGGVLPGYPQITEGRILHRIVEGGDPLHHLPAGLHAAVHGDPQTLAAMLPAVVPDARDPDWLRAGWSRTVYLTTSCEDGDFPWARSATPAERGAAASRELDRLGDRAFAPFDRAVGAQYGAQKICVPWPESGRRPLPRPVPNVPALLLVGGDDDVAPLEGAREIAAGLPRSRTVVVPGVGHGVLYPTGPGARALRAFAAGLRL